MGICTTILGPILPALSFRWHLNDIHAGYLFTAQFVGSSLGGLLAAIQPYRSILIGFIAVTLGLTSFTMISSSAAVPVTSGQAGKVVLDWTSLS